MAADTGGRARAKAWTTSEREWGLSCRSRRRSAGVSSWPTLLPGDPGEHAAYRLLGEVRRGVTLDQLPAALPVLPGHLAELDDVAARWRDLPDALANASKLAETCRDGASSGAAPRPETNCEPVV